MNDLHRPFIRALAIFLIAVAAAGCATQQVAQTPRNVIIMYADGVAATQLEFGRYSSQALRNQPYAITDTVLKQGTIGLLTTHPYEAFEELERLLLPQRPKRTRKTAVRRRPRA